MAEHNAQSLGRLLAPRQWPAWAGFGLMWVCAKLPYGLQLAIGTAVGRLMRMLIPRKVALVRANLEICFPELGTAQRDALLHEQFDALGIGIFEAATSWWGREAMLRRLLHVRGLEYLEAALARGKGVILLSAHFTTLEIGGRFLRMLHPFDVTYKKDKNPVVGLFMQRLRERLYEAAIERDDVREMLRRLKQNKIVWYAPDQSFSGKSRVFVTFFGKLASTNPATGRFARISGAAVVPFFARRLPGREGYELVFMPAVDNFPTGDPHTDAQRINHVFEDMIRQAPAQYMWVQKRFRAQPEGVTSPYEPDTAA